MRKIGFLLVIVAIGCLTVMGRKNVIANSDSSTIVADGPYVEKTFKFGAFETIKSTGVVDIDYVEAGGRCEGTLTVPSNLADYVKIEVVGGVLNVGMKQGRNLNLKGKKIKLAVAAPAISEVSISGTGDFDSKYMSGKNISFKISGTGDIEVDKLECKNLSVSVSGTGDVECDGLSASDVNVGISGTGDVELVGKCSKATLSVSGTGDIKAYKLNADAVEASATGTGDIKCKALRSISARCSGTGSITYAGNPSQVNVTKGVSKK